MNVHVTNTEKEGILHALEIEHIFRVFRASLRPKLLSTLGMLDTVNKRDTGIRF